MANEHIKADKTTEITRNNMRAIRLIREGWELMLNNRAAMIQMRGENNGSDAAHYAVLAVEGGYEQGTFASANAAAKASFDELEAAYVVLNGAPMNALLAACAKHNA